MRYPPEVSGISTKDGGSQPKMYFVFKKNETFHHLLEGLLCMNLKITKMSHNLT